jgi:chaperone required for assembly of F1-ATPase
MSHIPPLDPNVAAAKGFREPGDRPKRFWKAAGVAEVEGGHAVQLDGRTPKTPAGRPLVLPTAETARRVAAEWDRQTEVIEPATMPATRLASTALDAVCLAREAVADEIAAYAGTDLICYPAEAPTSLRARQDAEWGRWRDWAAEHGIRLEPGSGIVHRAQSPEALARVKALALELDDFALTGLASLVPMYGSAILALAVLKGALSAEAAHDLSRLDEAFQESQWGIDAEAAERTAAIRAEAMEIDAWFRALGL